MLPLNILSRAMLEVGTAPREPPQLPLLMNPVLSPFHLSEVRMVHIATPDVIPARGPPYWYLVVNRRGHQAKQTLLGWRAMALEFFFLRNIQTWEQALRVIGVVARDVLVVLDRADCDSGRWNGDGFCFIRESDLVGESGFACIEPRKAETLVT